MVWVKWDFLIEISLGIGSICEKVAADTTLVGLVGRGISDPVLTPEMLSDRSSSDLISQQYNHPTNRTVRCPMRNHVPRKTSQLPSVVNGPRQTYAQILHLFSPRFGFIACLRVAAVCSTKNFYSVRSYTVAIRPNKRHVRKSCGLSRAD